MLALSGAAWLWLWPEEPSGTLEQPIRVIPLAGGPELPDAEISGLAWYGDELVLLPQYPERFGHVVFVAARQDLEDVIEERTTEPVRVRRVPLDAPGLVAALPGFDGYEAIAFADDDVYVTVETRQEPDRTVGYLMAGSAAGAGRLERITIDVGRRRRLAAQTDLTNTAYEAITVDDERVLALYETNGEVNPEPRVLAFDRRLEPLGALPMAALEYRLTDASAVDAGGRFWVTNYHWPGSPWQPGACSLTEQYGRGPSHARCRTVERLVELGTEGDRVAPTGRPPILFELIDDLHARNWEGLVRMSGGGFLVMTDEYPTSILAYVAEP